jgi:hypothetical protein
MTREPQSNIEYRCPGQPDPKFADLPPVWFVDKYCKLGFPLGNGKHEYMWVFTTGFATAEDCELKGILSNDPIWVKMKSGDLVEFNRSSIIDLLDKNGEQCDEGKSL